MVRGDGLAAGESLNCSASYFGWYFVRWLQP